MDRKELIAKLQECQERPAQVGCVGCSMHKDGGDCELFHGQVDLLITRALKGLTDADTLIAGLMTERDGLAEEIKRLQGQLDTAVALNATLYEDATTEPQGEATRRVRRADRHRDEAAVETMVQQLLRETIAERLRDPHTRIDYCLDKDGGECLEIYTDFCSE